MKISIIQSDIYWENPTANLANFEEKIAKIEETPDLILLPEMFNSGFTMNYAEPMNFTTHKWMQQLAEQYQCTIAGSVAINENGKKFNRFIFVDKNKNTVFYNKRHLFGLGSENISFTAGNENIILNIEGFNVLPQICYDLRFPVWSRNANAKYDVLIYVASWPKTRIEAWKTLLKARAIENQCYVIGLNRIGTDGNNLEYNGQSCAFDFEGNVILEPKEGEFVNTINLDFDSLKMFRDKFPFLKDADNFEIL